MNEEEKVPYFEDEDNKMVDGIPVIERDNVEVFLIDKKENKLLCLDWEKFGWKTVIMGGLDGDTPEVAAKKETLEETGYKNIKFIQGLGKTRSGYYAAHKKKNHIATTIGLFFELVDYKQDVIKKEELEKHKPVWVSIDEVSNYLTISAQKYFWDMLKNIIS